MTSVDKIESLIDILDDKKSKSIQYHDKSSLLCFAETPLGNGFVINENKSHYMIEMDSMLTSMNKSECTVYYRVGINMTTPFGHGTLINSNSNTTHYLVEMDNMMVSVIKSECILFNNKYYNREKKMIECLRTATKMDLCRVYTLYDEKATDVKMEKQLKRSYIMEKLYFRHLYAGKYFKVFTLNGYIIGFITGTIIKTKQLTLEILMARSHICHDEENGKHLCIMSCCIDERYRRKGYGVKMMTLYVNEFSKLLLQKEKKLQSIRLHCRKTLIGFYKKCGYKLIGEAHSKNYGKVPWYLMGKSLMVIESNDANIL
eukprot:57423_1